MNCVALIAKYSSLIETVCNPFSADDLDSLTLLVTPSEHVQKLLPWDLQLLCYLIENLRSHFFLTDDKIVHESQSISVISGRY